MTLKIGSFVMNCKDFDRTAAFWQEALHYVPRRAGTRLFDTQESVSFGLCPVPAGSNGFRFFDAILISQVFWTSTERPCQS